MAITSRGVIGEFYNQLQIYTGMSWIDLVSMYFTSDQDSEEYDWLGMSPAMREWVGGRHAKGLNENAYEIKNKLFEATLEISADDLRRDKTGQLKIRIADLARRAVSHWATLLSTIITNGQSGACYDDSYFYAADHSEGESGTQSNLLTYTDVPALAVTERTTPTVTESIDAILGCIAYMQGIKDDQGEPMNSEAKQFTIMTAPSLWAYLVHATTGEIASGGASNLIKELEKQGYVVQVLSNPRLTYTYEFEVLRTDAVAKPFIRQEEEPITMAAKAEGSEFEFDTNRHQYGIKAQRNVGYGMWQHAAHATLSNS